MKYTKLGHDRPRRVEDLPRLHELRRLGIRQPHLDARRGDGRGFIKDALESGINFFDTANVYSLGTSEEIVGRALADFADRDEVVLATKVHGPMRRGRNAAGLSRKAIMTEVDASLRRLGMDYIDLYQIHRFDPRTPIEETMEALHDVVKSGKVRYIGASSMWAWQFSKAQYTAELHGWTKFVSMQNHYNLLNREEEREMMPLCVDQGVGVIPWSPLARGKLDPRLGRHHRAVGGRRVRQQAVQPRQRPGHRRSGGRDRRRARRPARPGGPGLDAVEAVRHVADRRGDQAAPHRLTRSPPSRSSLSRDEIDRLEEPYTPHQVAGFT